ncbi:hypothetical protein H5410_036434 [Solanum commersonii]|uniref:Uncharacterized protein n=1 Tax=Solanum commersonii TaxID=4109 RepID=A0A9J5Y5B0_SOLCO|nr:hypothetical protein H5410_036434 [Solanum commersonii]
MGTSKLSQGGRKLILSTAQRSTVQRGGTMRRSIHLNLQKHCLGHATQKIERPPLEENSFRARYQPSPSPTVKWSNAPDFGNKSRLWNSLLVGFLVLKDFLAPIPLLEAFVNSLSGFYRSGGCREEILRKGLCPSRLPFNPHRKIEAFSGSHQRRNGHTGSISQGKTTTAWLGFDTQRPPLKKIDAKVGEALMPYSQEVAGRDRGIVAREGRPDRGLPAIGNGTTRRGVGETGLGVGRRGVLTRPPNRADQGQAGHKFESCHLSYGPSCGYRMMGITKQKFGNEHEMSIYELFHYSLFPGLFIAFTYNKKQPPVFGAALAFWCILLSFLGLSFRHIPNNLSNYNILTANTPFFYQTSGTWSNHEGSILSWCRILSFYGFLLCYRGRPLSHNVSKRGAESHLTEPDFDRPALFMRALPRKENELCSSGAKRSVVARRKKDVASARDDKESFDLSISGLTELLALICFSLLSYQSSNPFVEISSFMLEPLAGIKSRSTRSYSGYTSSLHLCRRRIKNDKWDCGTPLAANAEECPKKNGTLFRYLDRRIPYNKRALYPKIQTCGGHGREGGVSLVMERKTPLLASLLDRRRTRWSRPGPGTNSNLDLDMSVVFNRRGGWWFRDPIENASFMPRVLATEPFQYGPDC